MNDVIRKVVQAEDEARRLVEEARAAADLIVAGARNKARQLTEDTRLQTKTGVEQLLATADREARLEKQRRVDAVAAGLDGRFRPDSAARQGAVDAAVRCVCSGKWRKQLSDRG